MNFKQLEVFYAIMIAGSVTGAARSLNISQPAVSEVLKHTEYQLKMKLFHRNAGRIQPTPEATILFSYAQEVFGHLESINHLTQSLSAGRSGYVALASTVTLLDALIPQALVRFRQVSPKVVVSVHPGPRSLVIERVSRRQADLGLIYGSFIEADIEIEELTTSSLTCVLPSGSTLRSKPHITVQDLQNQSLISYGRHTSIGRLIDNTCKQAGVELPAFATEVSSSFTACLMVGAGAGVALVDPLVRRTGKLDDLIFKPFRPLVKIESQLIFPRGRPRSIATQLFARHLKKWVRES